MRLFTDIFREYRNGRAADKATSKMAELVAAVDETGKSGEITIKLKIKPDKAGGSQKTLACVVTCKIPDADLPEAVFFSDAAGGLHRTDPEQREMFTEAGRSTAARD
jgi:hypothetical protein